MLFTCLIVSSLNDFAISDDLLMSKGAITRVLSMGLHACRYEIIKLINYVSKLKKVFD